MRPDPINTKEWRAIALEAKLTRQLCGTGLTAIGRANYADGMGEYYSAFFALSVGIERLAKLILCVEHYMNNAGAFPLEKEMRAYGHKIERLITQIKRIQENRSIELKFGVADDPICAEIIQFLDVFSDAKRGRYANLGALISPNFDARNEPIALWYEKVGQTVLNKHFRGKPIEAKAKKNAETIERLMGGYSIVRHTAEDGTSLNSLSSASYRTAENEILQKFGRFYSFVVIRFLSEIFTSMTSAYGYSDEGYLWFGHYEHFNTFNVPNEFGLNRKIWPLH